MCFLGFLLLSLLQAFEAKLGQEILDSQPVYGSTCLGYHIIFAPIHVKVPCPTICWDMFAEGELL